MARGLITDTEGRIIARPFIKFFNINETDATKVENLPLEKPLILEKLDGSLGILYFYGNKPCIATRGSFNSEQAVWATEWIQKTGLGRIDFDPELTYLFEIIYPQNRIVVNYEGTQALFLLATVITKNGLVCEHKYTKKEAELLKFDMPEQIDGDVRKLTKKLKELPGNEEGFVVRYSSGLILKMKGEEYLRLHKLITGFSTKSIWECLKDGQDITEILERVPDEFYKWAMGKNNQLKSDYKKILAQAEDDYDMIMNSFADAEVAPPWARKDFAVKTQEKKYPSILFTILDGKDVAPIIWKMLKPKYELPFHTGE